MPIPSTTRRAVAARARHCCEYCRSQLRFSADSFSIEHVISRALGGSDDFENLALACQRCNNAKYTAIEALDPLTGKAAPLFHPRKDEWPKHFTWTHDYSMLLGLTPTGRATVEKLRLNREGVVNLRRVLREAGEHPLDAD